MHCADTLSLCVREYRRNDRRQVTEFLSIVPRLYPGGFEWLQKRLDDVEVGKASCTIATQGATLGGVLIDSDKGLRRRKICTFLVDSKLANRGLGTALFSSCKARWLRAGIEKLHLTAAGDRRSHIEGFLLRRNFSIIAIERNRYGAMRDEIVYASTLT